MTGWTDAVQLQRQLEAAEATAAEWQARAEELRVEAQVQRDRADAATRERDEALQASLYSAQRERRAEDEAARLQAALNAERAHAKFASDEHGKADAECERLQADASDLHTRIAEIEAVLDQESRSRLEACEALAAANARIKAVQAVWANPGASARALHDALEKL